MSAPMLRLAAKRLRDPIRCNTNQHDAAVADWLDRLADRADELVSSWPGLAHRTDLLSAERILGWDEALRVAKIVADKDAQRADMDAEYDDTNPGGW